MNKNTSDQHCGEWSTTETQTCAYNSNSFWHMARYECWLLTYLQTYRPETDRHR